jgi:hypothetical protein
MIISQQELDAVQHAAALEQPLKAVEAELAALGRALQDQDLMAVDSAAAALHLALAAAMDQYGRAARSGGLPPVLRQRLALAGGQVAAQREALARATASLDRAIDVLIPRATPSGMLYSSGGANDRRNLGAGGLLA